MTATEHADVLVVGAGPTGLMLAGDLAQAGVRVTVLERRAEESNVTRAFAVHARTMEELQIRGVAAELAATGTPIGGLRLYGHAAIDLTRLPSVFASLLITPQYRTERVLAARLDRLGVAITREAEVVGLTQDAAGVDVRVRASDGAERCYQASYVAGADGVHLRSSDIAPQEVRKIWGQSGSGNRLAIGVSCHAADKIQAAASTGADFVVFAPVFEKANSRETTPTGLDGLREACRHNIPVLALGGITLENAHSCKDVGAAGIAGIRLFQNNNVADVVRRLRS